MRIFFVAISILERRKLTIEIQKLTYFAGGGITLLSEAKKEYQEMLAKVESFFNLLTKS